MNLQGISVHFLSVLTITILAVLSKDCYPIGYNGVKSGKNENGPQTDDPLTLCWPKLEATHPMCSCRPQIESQILNKQGFSSNATISSWMPDSALAFLQWLDADAVLWVLEMRSPFEAHCSRLLSAIETSSNFDYFCYRLSNIRRLDKLKSKTCKKKRRAPFSPKNRVHRVVN